jgi:hypothetical protein
LASSIAAEVTRAPAIPFHFDFAVGRSDSATLIGVYTGHTLSLAQAGGSRPELFLGMARGGATPLVFRVRHAKGLQCAVAENLRMPFTRYGECNDVLCNDCSVDGGLA